VNYRSLYFFDDVKDKIGRIVHRRAVIAHGCTKEDKVDAADINLVITRRKKYLADRAGHTYVPPADEVGAT